MLRNTEISTFEAKIFNGFEYLTREREEKLISEVNSPDKRVADKAIDVLVTSHMRLVKKLVNLKSRRIKSPSFDKDDLIQEAAIGLCLATQGFKPEHGVRFATYANYWVRQAIDNYIHSNNHSLRFPVTGANRRVVNYYYKVRHEILNKHGNQLNEDQVIKLVAKELMADELMVRSVARVLDFTPISIDQETTNEEGEDFVFNLVDTSPLADEIMEVKSELEEKFYLVEAAVKKLKPRERDIYQKRILCHREERESLAVLGEKYNVSRERIRQLEVRIMEKISNSVLKAHKRKKRTKWH